MSLSIKVASLFSEKAQFVCFHSQAVDVGIAPKDLPQGLPAPWPGQI